MDWIISNLQSIVVAILCVVVLYQRACIKDHESRLCNQGRSLWDLVHNTPKEIAAVKFANDYTYQFMREVNDRLIELENRVDEEIIDAPIHPQRRS